MSGYVQTTGSFPKGLVPGVNKWIEKSYKDWDEEYSKIFDRMSSQREYEEYAGTIGYGLAQAKPEGSNITYDAARQGFVTRIYNVTYALGFQVTMEEMQDNRWGPKAFKSGRALARSFRQTKEVAGGLILSRAFTSTYAGADGKELCATDHPNKFDGSTYSNELNPALDLSELALEQICIQISEMEDERGQNIKLMPRRLIVSTGDVFNAERILKSTLQNDTANNAINALRSRGIFPDGYMVSHYYSAGDGAWFVKTDAPDSLVYQDRIPFGVDEDNEFENKNLKFSAVERYGFGWDAPRGFFGSAGAA